ncbi:hypothetical protein MINTM007_04150 [Mycobacterium intracellulare]|nr:hypothetical protein MINTM007_04150 [Mycobacterium intracellulare]
MVVAYLALDESPAVLVGRLMFLLGLPATGLTLLIIGLGRRSRARRQTPPLPPPYHPGYPYRPDIRARTRPRRRIRATRHGRRRGSRAPR